MASTSSLVGRKWQYYEPSNESHWKYVKDYRFKAGETISIYRQQKSATGTITWTWDESRTLQGASPRAIVGLALAALYTAFVF